MSATKSELMLEQPLYVLVKIRADGTVQPIKVSLDTRLMYSAAFDWEHAPGPNEKIVILKVHHAELMKNGKP